MRTFAFLTTLLLSALTFAQEPPLQWFKGHTHTHSLWSDGDAPPEWIAAWYKEHGYNFLCLSEHHILQHGEKLITVREKSLLSPERVQMLRDKFGPEWVQIVEQDGNPRMRLKTHEELSAHFNEPGKFLLIEGEEITTVSGNPHVIGLNLREAVKNHKGKTDNKTILEQYFGDIDKQEAQHGQPMLGHLNHLNWNDGVSVESLLDVPGLKFLEVYNGQRSVHTWGWPEKKRPSSERSWDILLALRIQNDPNYILYGVGTDDCHDYWEWGPSHHNPGRGWVMVRAAALEANALVEAMERGDFYISTGVSLKDVRRDGNRITLEIAPEKGVTYKTQFIGTRKGFDPTSTPALDDQGQEMTHTTRNYSDTIGQVFSETAETTATYELTGDELYVRAKVTSSKPQENAPYEGDTCMAWTQPFKP